MMSNRKRRITMSVTMVICLVYLVYRGVFTLNWDGPFAATFSITLYIAEVYGNLLMFLYFFQIWNPTLPEPVPPLDSVRVDAYIPTYDEEPELLRGTIEAAVAMDYPHETYVLDDKARPEVKQLCDELGAKYIKRDSNIHAKAGNLNHAMEITDGEFIIIFDADHIAEKNFITRTLGYFADPKLAFVQTPHSYYNFDSFQGTLDYERNVYWEEGQLFYNIVQPGKNHWNSASFCGSAAIFRKSALEDVGLVATESITEDMQTGLRLHSRGWNSLYINERLVSGLAAPDLATFTVQRLRWGEGNLGTIFYDNPFTMPGLSLAQRLNYIALMFCWTTGVQKFILYFAPLLMLLTGVGPVADMTWHLVAITVIYVISIWYTVKASGNGYGRLIDTEITQMASYWTQCRATWRAIFNRKNATFVVTKKSGGGASGIHDFLRPQYAYIAASVVSITWAAARYFLGISEDILGLSICSVLVAAHCVFAWIVIRRALAQRRFDWRHPMAAHLSYEVDGEQVQVGHGFTKDMSETGMSFIAYEKLKGYHVTLTITAGDCSVRLPAEIKTSDELAKVKSRRDGNISAYRYGAEYKELTNQQKKAVWHICTKYAVGRSYHNFDPQTQTGLLDPVSKDGDANFIMPVRLYRPDTGDFHGVTEKVSGNEFAMVTPRSLGSKKLLRAEITSCSGPITGNVRVTSATPIALGQLELWAYRFHFDAFDNQSRGRLTTLINLSSEDRMKELSTLRPKKTGLPFAGPAAIVGGLSAIAAVVTLCVILFLFKDDVLLARAVLKKPIDTDGRERIATLVSYYEKNPTNNERYFLRVREAAQGLEDDDAIQRLNLALLNNQFRLPAAKLQKAYALEQTGRVEDAKVAFQELLENIRVFGSKTTRANLMLAAARNSVALKDFPRAVKLYRVAYLHPGMKFDIRSEFAGVLTSAGDHEVALKLLLAADELSREDRFLLADIYVALEDWEKAHELLVQLSEEDATLRARKALANVESWSRNYKSAIQRFRTILREHPEDLEARIALTESLVWNRDLREALSIGEQLMPELDVKQKVRMATIMLEAIAQLDYVTEGDRTFALRMHGQRSEFPPNEQFIVTMARALNNCLEEDECASLVENLFELHPTSRELQLTYARILYGMGESDKAAAHYAQLLATDALPTDLFERGELLLAAALNSARRGSVLEASRRYDVALDCFLELFERDYEDTKTWMPFLNAVSGAKRHTQEIQNAVLKIFNSRSLIADNDVAMRLSDALSKIQRDDDALQVLDELANGSEVELGSDFEFRRANVLLRLGENLEADKIYSDLLKNRALADEQDSQISLLLATASNHALLDEPEKSKDLYAQALALLRPLVKESPDQTTSWIPFLSAVAGYGEINSRDRELVREIYRRREKLYESTEFVQRLKDVMLSAQELKLSVPLLYTLTERNPRSRELRFRLAQALQAIGDRDEAEVQYRYLLDDLYADRSGQPKENVTAEEILLGAAQNARSLFKVNRAAQLYKRCITTLRQQIHNDIGRMDLWLPYLSALHGCESYDFVDSQLVLEIYDLREMHRPNANFVANLTESLIFTGQQDLAIDLLQNALDRFPNDGRLHHLMAQKLSGLEDHSLAAKHYEWLLANSSAKDEPIRHGQLLMEAAENSRQRNADAERISRTKEAFALFAAGLDEDPNNETLWQPYLDAAASIDWVPMGRRRQVLLLLDNWRKYSDDPEFVERLADVLIKNGHARRAVPLLEHIEDRSFHAVSLLGSLLSGFGQYAKAEARIQTALRQVTKQRDRLQVIDLYLVGANNARAMGNVDLAANRSNKALVEIRTALVKNPSSQDLLIKFLNASIGVKEMQDKDLERIDQLVGQWQKYKDTTLQLRLVDALLKLQRPQEALPIIESLVSREPEPEHVLRLAKAHHDSKNYADAELHYVDLLEAGMLRGDDHYQLYLGSARNSLALEDYAESRRRFERLIKMRQDDSSFLVEYAIVLEKTGDRSKAAELMNGLHELNGEQQFALAAMMASMKEFERAKKIYNYILQEDEDHLEAQRALAFACLWNKDYVEAIFRLEALMLSQPGDVEVEIALASANLWNKNFSKASKMFAHLVQEDPTNAELNSRFVEAATRTSDLTLQQQNLLAAIESRLQTNALTPKQSRRLREQLADYYADHDNADRAIRFYQQVMDDGPVDGQFRRKFAFLLMRENRPKEAATLFKEVLATARDDDEIRLQLAYAYLQNKQFAKASREFGRVLDGGSIKDIRERAEVILAAAYATQESGDPIDAQAKYELALNELSVLLLRDSENTDLWVPFLNAATGTENWSPGVETIAEEILANRDLHAETLEFELRLADVLVRLGRNQAAARLLSQLIDKHPGRREYWLPFARALAGVKTVENAQLTQLKTIQARLLKGALEPDYREEFLLRLSDVLLNAGEYENVLRVLKSWKRDSNIEVSKRRAFALIGLNRITDAVPIYQQWLTQDPEDLEVHYLMALGLKETGRHQDAVKYFDNLLSDDIESDALPAREVEIRLAAAENLRLLGDVDSVNSAEAMRKSVADELLMMHQVNPQDRQVWTDLSRVIGLVKSPDDIADRERETLNKIYLLATENLQGDEQDKTEESLPLAANTASKLADALFMTKAWPKAQGLYEYAIRLNPENSRALLNLGVALVKQQQYEPAQKHFDAFLERLEPLPRTATSALRRKRADVLLACAGNMVRVGRSVDAYAIFNESLRLLTPLATMTLEGVVHWQSYLDSLAGSERISSSAAELVMKMYEQREWKAGDRLFYTRMSDVLIRMKRFDETLELLTVLEPKDDGINYRIAQALTELERDEEAAALLADLIDENAFSDFKQRRAELFLVAASNSGRRAETDEMSTRYMHALKLWRELFFAQRDNGRLWPRYLDAAAGAKKLEAKDALVTLEIFGRYGNFDYLQEDVSFRSRLVDVMIRIEHPEQVLPLSLHLFELDETDDERRLRLANNLHAMSRFADADPYYDYLIDNKAFADDDQTRGQMMVTAARNNVSMGNFAEARRIFELVWKLDLKNREYEVEYAVVLQKTGDPEMGKRVLRREPLNLDQQYRLASMYTSARELTAADEVYQQILQESPGELIAIRRRAALLVWKREYPDAKRLLEQLLISVPTDKGLLRYLAIAKLRSGERVQALRMLRELVAETPTNEQLFLPYLEALGQAKSMTAQDKGWIGNLVEELASPFPQNDQIDASPTRTELTVALAVPLTRIGRSEQAVNMLNQILEQVASPVTPAKTGEPSVDRSTALQALADVYMRTGQVEEAIGHYESLLQEQPESEYNRMQLAYGYQKLQHYTKAASYFEPFLENEQWVQDSFDGQLEFLLAAANNSRQRNRLAEANERYFSVFERLLADQKKQSSFEAKTWLPLLKAANGIELSALNEAAEFVQLLEVFFEQRHEVLGDEPSNRRDALLYYAELASKLQLPDRAKEVLVELLNKDPEDQYIRIRLAKHFWRTKEFASAGEEYHRILESFESDADLTSAQLLPWERIEVYLDAADVFQGLGQETRAYELATQGMELISPQFEQGLPDSPKAWLQLIRAANLTNSTSLTTSDRVSQIFLQDWRGTGNRFLWAQLGEALYRVGRTDEAAKVFALLPDSDETRLWRLADIATKARRFPEAMSHYQALLESDYFTELDPQYYDIQLAMANLHHQMGDLDASQTMYRSLVEEFRARVHSKNATERQVETYLSALLGMEKLDGLDQKWVDRAFIDALPIAKKRRCELVAALAMRFASEDVADKFFERLMKEAPTPGNRLAFARYLVKAQRLDQALPVILDLLKLDEIRERRDLFVELNVSIARIYIADEKYVEAREALEELGDPTNLVSTAEWALVLARTGERKHAAKLLASLETPSRDAASLLASIYIELKQFEPARAIYHRFLAEDPNDEEALRWLANSYFFSENYAEALTRYESMLERTPDDLELLESYGKSLLWIGRYDDAVPVLSNVVKRLPKKKDLWIPLLDAIAGSETTSVQDPLFVYIDKNYLDQTHADELAERLARIYLVAGEPNAALSRLKPLLRNPEVSDALQLVYADVLAALSRYDDAIMVYESLFERIDELLVPTVDDLTVATNPKDVQGLETEEDESQDSFDAGPDSLVDNLSESSGEDQTLVTSNEGRQGPVEPVAGTDAQARYSQFEIAEFHLRFADLLQRAKYYRDARREYDLVLEVITPSKPTVYRRLLLSSARNYIALKEYDAGIDQFEHLRRLDPEKFAFFEEYAGALLSAGRPRKALDTIQQAKSLTMKGEYLLGGIYANLQEFREASAVFRQIVAKHPREWRAYRELADVSVAGKDYRTAIYVYSQLLRRTPDSISLQVGLANAYLWSGQPNRALPVFTRILTKEPDRYDLWPSFAQAANAEGVELSRTARKLMQSIVARKANWPKEIAFRREIVGTLFRLDLHEDAFQMLREMLKDTPQDLAVRRRLADELHKLKRFAEAEKHYDILLKQKSSTRTLNVNRLRYPRQRARPITSD